LAIYDKHAKINLACEEGKEISIHKIWLTIHAKINFVTITQGSIPNVIIISSPLY
jgi:hypothetical protein